MAEILVHYFFHLYIYHITCRNALCSINVSIISRPTYSVGHFHEVKNLELCLDNCPA